MAGFNLTAQLQLQAPTNTSQVVGNIKKQLSGITANIQVKANAQTLAKLNKQMQGVSKSSESASKGVSNLNRNLSEAARRFSVITVATGTMLSLARAIKNAVGEAIAFERELVKISQVTGKTVGELGNLSSEVTRLSTSLGASSKDLLNVSRVLAQAGFSATKTKQALDILAKTSLGATFDSIQDTTEGAIAVLRQFRKEARAAGGDIKFLEQTMDAINSVSKSFAVESGDLITVIRRVGGVFESAGGSVNELIALFTSVRATTRESAETISTGLRTIFTRIQRTDTVDQLKQLGIQLRDSQGQFVGAFEAVRRLSQGLSSLDPRDFRFSEIVESLGGFRQIGKVIPLIQQFATAQNALNVAQSASGSVAEDAITAQKSLAVQAQKVREEFSALIRKLADSSTFRSVAGGALEMAKAFIRVVDALEPLLPLLTTMISLKIGSALAPGLASLAGVKVGKKAQGGRIHKFARGGFVPGTGNRDTVPAMLQPGEFVIKKSSANKLGAGTLEAMNNNRFNRGSFGGVKKELDATRKTKAIDFKKGLKIKGETTKTGGTGSLTAALGEASQLADIDTYAAAFLRPEARGKNFSGTVTGLPAIINKALKDSGVPIKNPAIQADAKKIAEAYKSRNKFELRAGSLTGSESERLETTLIKGIVNSARDGAKLINGSLGIQGDANVAQSLKSANFDQVVGNLFELVLSNAGAPFGKPDTDPANAPFDFPKGLGAAAGKFGLPNTLNGKPVKTEAKSFFSEDNISTLTKKVQNELKNESVAELRQIFAKHLSGRGGESSLDDLKKAFGGGSAADIIARADKSGVDVAQSGRGKYTVRQRRASGGSIYGQDSVPSLLTPGEFVINKSAAQSIGYGNLNKMNQTGVQRFATGGAVGWKKFAKGGPTGAGMGLATMSFGSVDQEIVKVQAAFEKLGLSGDKLTQAVSTASDSLLEGSSQAEAFDTAFGEMKNGIEKTKKAAEAASKVSGAGDVAAMDAKAYTTDISGEASLAQELAGGGDQQAQGVLAEMQKKEAAAIAKKIRAADKEVTASEALSRARNVVRQKYGGLAQKADNSLKSIEEENKARKSFTQKLKEAKGRLQKGAGAVKGFVKDPKAGLGKIGQGAQKLQGGAQAAQNIAFMGTTAIATAVQMSSLSDSTKQAATETLAFASGLLGIGSTVVQMLSGLATVGTTVAAAKAAEAAARGAAAGADTLEAGASATSAVTEGVEAAADTAEAVASFAAAGPILLLVGAVAALFLALKFFSSKARAEAEEMAKGRKKNLDKIGSGEGGDVDAAKASVETELALRDTADAFNIAANSALVGAAAGAALGATFGSGIPVFGTLVGAVVGAVAGYFLLSDAMEEEAKARQEQIKGIHESIDTFSELSKSGKQFDDAMAGLDSSPVKDTSAAGLRKRAEQELDITKDLKTGDVSTEFDKLATLAAKAGKSVSKLEEADFEEGSADLIAFQTATLASQKSLENLAKKSKAAGKTLADAVSIEADSGKSFDELMAEGGLLAKAFKASQDAIEAEGKAREAAAQADADSARKRANQAARDNASFSSGLGMVFDLDNIMSGASFTGEGFDTSAMELEQDELFAEARVASQKAAAEQKKYEEAMRQSKQATEAVTNANAARVESEKRAAAAAAAFAQSLYETQEFLKGLSDLEFAQQQRDQDQGNRAAIRSGDDMDFTRNIRGLEGSSTEISDIGQFTRDINAAISQMPQALQGEARKQLSNVQLSQQVFGQGKKDTLTQFSNIGSDDKIDQQLIDDVIKTATGGKAIDADIRAKLEEDLNKALEGGLTVDEFDKVFKGFAEVGDSAQESFQRINALYNNEIQAYGAYLNEIQAAREKDVENQQNVLAARQKGVQLRAEARGQTVSIDSKERQRTQSAQLALQGTGARAGDVGSVSAAKKAAQASLNRVRLDQKAGRITVSQAQQRNKQLNDIVKKTTAELKRLADQSDRAADIMGEIEKERGKREAVTGLVEDFVVGDDSSRKAIVDSMLGVQKAVATGTVQNQTPEQRQATFGLLDKLADVEIAGTGGLTGKDVKQELIFRDAIQMGLDPQIAQQLATATTKEEQLINALDKLTMATEAAAAAQMQADRAAGGAAKVGGFQGTGIQFAKGGVVYKSDGGNIFQPKGTDTVPAMLTPGEFVVKKSSVDKIGLGTLSAINSGKYSKGGVVYRQGGGPINAAGGTIGGLGIPSGDQFRKMFIESAQSLGPAGFLKIIRDVYGAEAKEVKKAAAGKASGRKKAFEIEKTGKGVAQSFATLIKAGALNPQKIAYPDFLASYLDSVLANASDILENTGGGLAFKPTPRIDSLVSGKNLPESEKESIKAAAQVYSRKLASIRGVGSGDIAKDKRGGRIVDLVIQRAMGFTPSDNLFRFAGIVKQRKRIIDDYLKSNKITKGGVTAGLASEGGIGGKKAKPLSAKLQQATDALVAAGALKMATGGNVPGASDTVPAMLTPGEFVMSKGAVQKHGIGYMKSLNRGRIPGFNRGGLVGRGAVQYKHAGGDVSGGGGVLSLDPTRVQEVLDGFNSAFASSLDAIVGPFSGISQNLGRVADAFGSMTMTHQFSGELSLSVNISNKDAIIEAVKTGITPELSSLIERQVNESINAIQGKAIG